MKRAFAPIIVLILAGCSVTKDGVVINVPTTPSVSICQNVANDADITNMKSKIDAQSFKDEKLARARLVTKDYCFVAKQVVSLLECFNFEDSKLALAKDLYDQTTDKSEYDVVVDALTYKSDRDELLAYISQHP